MFDGSSTVCFHTWSCPPPPVGRGGGLSRRRSSSCLKVSAWAFAAPSAKQKQQSALLHTSDGSGSGSDGVLESKAGAGAGAGAGTGAGAGADAGAAADPLLMGGASSRPVLSQPNTVGVIGGVSAISTLTFLQKLVGWSCSEGGEEGSLPFIVCSEPVLSKERGGSLPPPQHLIPSRNARLHIDRAHVVEGLRRKRVFLERSGARCIVMPCNVSHSWHGDVADGCAVPFLHMGECVAKQLKSANLRPVEAGNNVRIGVLATDAVLTAAVYQDKLQDLGFEVVLPDKATMEHTVVPAVEALGRKDVEGARTLLRIALQVLLVKAVSTIILASDDMRGLLPQDDPLLKKCFDPVDALARSTIEWAESVRKARIST